MKAWAMLILMLAACSMWAQDYPRFEVAAGYSYGSVDTQGFGTQRNAQGWSGSLTGNFQKWLGMELDISGRYNTLTYDFQGNSLTTNSRYYTFLLGPRFAYRKGKVSPFVHSLFGVDRAPAFDNTVYDPATATALTPYVTGFATAVGGGVDYQISRRLAFRSQADYFFTRHAALVSPTPNNFRVQAAIVFTFGGSESLDAKRNADTPTVAEAPAPAPETNKPAEVETAAAQPVTTQKEVPAQSATLATNAQPAQAAPATNAVAPSPNPVPVPQAVQPAAAKPAAVVAQQRAPVEIIISQPASQYQVSARGEEPLGDVARRYRERKQRNSEASGQ